MIVLKLLDGSVIHDARDEERQVVGYSSDAKNAVGTLEFDIYPKHPAYNSIKAGSTKIRAYRDGIWEHDYTVETVSNDMQLKKHVTATDELQYLERIEVPAYKTGEGGVPQTVSGFFMWLVEYYNVRSGGERFAFGQIEGDIIDPTTTLDRSSDSPATVASIIKDKIIDTIGGYLRVRRVNGVLTIDLKADAAGVCKQYIEFGENLVDYADEQDAGELYTAITAESTYKNDADEEVTITLADAPNGEYLAGYVKQGDTVTNTAAAAIYGVRRKHLTFDGIKNVYTLVENCEKYIAAHCEPVTTVNVSAADLSTLDSNVQSFDVGLYTRVKAAPMGFDAAFECQSAKRSLNDPTDDKYTLGWTWGSLSSINNRKSVEAALGIGKLEQATTEIDQAAKDAAKKADAAVVASWDEYAVSSSNSDPPLDGWATVTPVWTDGNYIWRRAVTSYGDGTTVEGVPACMTGNAGASGEDATVVLIDSSNGNSFKNNSVSTTLRAIVFHGANRITTIDALKAEYGSTARMEWSWQRLGEGRFGVISADDARISESGMALTISPADVDEKTNFAVDIKTD